MIQEQEKTGCRTGATGAPMKKSVFSQRFFVRGDSGVSVI